jgi:two-component system, NarL family, sensor kinase
VSAARIRRAGVGASVFFFQRGGLRGAVGGGGFVAARKIVSTVSRRKTKPERSSSAEPAPESAASAPAAPAHAALDQLSYRTLFTSAPVGILLADAEGRVLDINPILISLFDFESADAARNVNALRYKPWQVCGLSACIERCAAKNQPLVSEGLCLTDGGYDIYLRYYLTPIQFAPGAPPYVQCIVADLTSFKDTENKLRQLYAYFNGIVSSISPIATIDAQYKIRYVNEPFRKEFSPEKEPVGCSLFSVLKLNRTDRRKLSENVENHRLPGNAELTHDRRRIIGYSVFHFGEEIGLILKDITQIKRLERRVSALNSRLLEAQETERQAVASELHDSVGQMILAAKLNFTAYERNPERSRERFQVGLELIDRASQELREIYTNLFPQALNDLGLEAAVRWYAKNFLELKEIETDLHMNLSRKLSREAQTNLFRIIQEIFTNIVKHSRADRVQLELTDRDSLVLLSVQDNGAGFSPEKVRLKSRGFGLYTIQRRVDDLGGTMSLDSQPGAGVRFAIEIPITEAS